MGFSGVNPEIKYGGGVAWSDLWLLGATSRESSWLDAPTAPTIMSFNINFLVGCLSPCTDPVEIPSATAAIPSATPRGQGMGNLEKL